MTYRVVQWTTGNVGRKSVHAVVANSDLDLVGCYAWSPDKVGRDAGELCDLDPLGVVATDDVDALLALKPDCVVYNPMFADVDELVRILGAGSTSSRPRSSSTATTSAPTATASPPPAPTATRRSSAAVSTRASSSCSPS